MESIRQTQISLPPLEYKIFFVHAFYIRLISAMDSEDLSQFYFYLVAVIISLEVKVVALNKYEI